MILNSRNKKIIIILPAIIISVVVYWLFTKDFTTDNKPNYGVTFSKKYAVDLGLNWKDAYLAIINDLKVDNIRLISYWDESEIAQDLFYFDDLDWQLDQLKDKDINVILVVGRRAPRWPECHDPLWIADLSLESVQNHQLKFVQKVIERYRDNQIIKAWQVENEPLFGWFGECPKPDKNFLIKEIELVRSLDNSPIIITDSGELSHWQSAASVADVLGITMYRIVWNKTFGFWDYFFVPASAYRFKANLTKFLNKNLQDIIITELQMEPWTMDRRMSELTIEEQQRSFTLKKFKENVKYARKAGFDQVYFWGVEYWYWLDQKGYPEIWQQAKILWK